MDTEGLRCRLVEEGFPPDLYGLDGSLPSYGGLILERSAGMWRIEHFERGMRRELESFSVEDQACRRMYELLVEHFR